MRKTTRPYLHIFEQCNITTTTKRPPACKKTEEKSGKGEEAQEKCFSAPSFISRVSPPPSPPPSPLCRPSNLFFHSASIVETVSEDMESFSSTLLLLARFACVHETPKRFKRHFHSRPSP